LGGSLRDVKPVVLPDLPGKRYLVVVDKEGKTPGSFPRRAGMPTKRPLC
jgi:16S rRNA (guanine527-N7)-methyltransferase